MSDPKIGLVIGTGAGGLRALTGAGAAKISAPAITHAPTEIGQHGRAWRCDIAEGRRQLNLTDAEDATVALWIVEAAWAHPAWHSYSLTLVHLRPMADGRKTKFYKDGATHEFWLYALDPGADLNPVIATGIYQPWLTPANFSAQMIEISDDLAIGRLEKSVEEICAGTLSPDTDFLRQWIERYGDNMIKKEFR